MPKKPLPSPQVVRELLRYEPETGKLYWRERGLKFCKDERNKNIFNRRFAGKEAFTADCGFGYRQGRVFDNAVRAHRVIWAIVYGKWPENEIDHINGNRSDNRLSNLRAVTRSENQKNRGFQKISKSGVIGVTHHAATGGWYAHIKSEGEAHYLGYFKRKADAVAARKAAEKRFNFHKNHGRGLLQVRG